VSQLIFSPIPFFLGCCCEFLPFQFGVDHSADFRGFSFGECLGGCFAGGSVLPCVWLFADCARLCWYCGLFRVVGCGVCA